MRLGFYYHIPAFPYDGNIYTPGYFGRFLDSLANACEQVVFFAHLPLKEEQKNLDYSLKSKNVKLVSMGPRMPAWKMSLFPRYYNKIVQSWSGSLDLLLIRGPTPLLPALSNAVQMLPTALLLVGDYVEGVSDLPQPLWRKALIRYWSIWNKNSQIRVAKKSLTFVNSQKIYDEYKDIIPYLIKTRTTSLTAKDFFFRNNACQVPPYHIAYVGRMDRTKGLMNLLESISILVQKGEDIILDFIGPEEKNDPIIQELRESAWRLNIENRVVYHGYIPFEPDLLNTYRGVDMLVIASLSSFEGFPRVIWEAMANCVPVVATKVGSIPSYIQGSAELVEPRDVHSLTEGISRMMHDSEFRKQCITTGYSLAKSNTLEIHVKSMVEEMEKWSRKID